MRFKLNHKQWTRHEARVSAAVRDADSDFGTTTTKEAERIRIDWARQWRPSAHLPYIGSSVTADVHHGGGIHTAEIGPEKGLGRQGSLGHLIENANGAARNRATHAGNKAGRRAEVRFERAAGEAAEDGIGG